MRAGSFQFIRLRYREFERACAPAPSKASDLGCASAPGQTGNDLCAVMDIKISVMRDLIKSAEDIYAKISAAQGGANVNRWQEMKTDVLIMHQSSARIQLPSGSMVPA